MWLTFKRVNSDALVTVNMRHVEHIELYDEADPVKGTSLVYPDGSIISVTAKYEEIRIFVGGTPL